MKKFLLFTIALVACQQIYAVTNIYNWRWRNDDGSETTATWKAAENTTFTLNEAGEKFRLRCEIVNENPDAFDISNDTLQYATSPGGPYTPILLEAGDRDFKLAGTAAVPDLGATTEQLSRHRPTYTFVSGFDIVSSTVFSKSLDPSRKTEYEWVIMGTANLKPRTTYYFRPSGQGDPNFQAQGRPNLRTGQTLPIKITSFTAQSQKQTTLLAWSTASEQNNDRFQILRSADGKTDWKAIGMIKGSGTTIQQSSYYFTDANPLKGNNFYRLKQFDMDGKFTESMIRSVNVKLSGGPLTVFPNPSKGVINFKLKEFDGTTLSYKITDVNGKIVQTGVLSASANNIYNLQSNSSMNSGSYLLNVKGAGLEKSTVIVFQR